MSDRVTFFVRRELRSGGSLWTIRGEGELEGCELSVGAPDAVGFRGSFPAPRCREELDRLRAKAREALGSKGRGGLIVETRLDARGLEARFEAVGGTGFSPPEALLVVRPGYPPELKSLNLRESLPLPRSSHLLVPVDREHGEQLLRFAAVLDFLPSDVGSLVLHCLGSPDLEERIDRLERRSGGRGEPVARADGRQGSWWAPRRWLAWLGKPAPVWLLLVLLLLLASWPWVGSSLQESFGSLHQPAAEVQGVPASPEPGGRGPVPLNRGEKGEPAGGERPTVPVEMDGKTSPNGSAPEVRSTRPQQDGARSAPSSKGRAEGVAAPGPPRKSPRRKHRQGRSGHRGAGRTS